MSETEKSRARRIREGFFEKYISGKGIDIGCGRSYGYSDDLKIHHSAEAHDIDVCDAHRMDKYEDESFDYVYASHVLEHMDDPILSLKNWYRILKKNGYMIITVPSMYRYEKRTSLPSTWNADHKRFYTLSSLASEIESSLEPNSYLVEYMKDCSEGFDWTIIASQHSRGEYQIECVLKKIDKPNWRLL